MCTAKLRLGLHPQFLCWCPLNFKSSSKFPRPHATLSNIAPACIYPYISQLIGSAAQLQAPGKRFSSRFGDPPMPSPTRPSSPHPWVWISPPVILLHFVPGRTATALVPIHILFSEPGRTCPFCAKELSTSPSTLYALKPFSELQRKENGLGDQLDLGLNSSSAISSNALDELFNLPEPV